MMRSLLHVALQVLARCQFNNLTKKKKKKIMKIRENKMASFGGASLAPCWRLPAHLAPSLPPRCSKEF